MVPALMKRFIKQEVHMYGAILGDIIGEPYEFTKEDMHQVMKEFEKHQIPAKKREA